jgi:hypothetical protein
MNPSSVRTLKKSCLAIVFAGICCTAGAAETFKPLSVPSADKKAGITMQLSDNWKTYPSKDGSVTIEMPKSGVNLQVFALNQPSVDEAVKQVTDLVTKFKVIETKEITVAGTAGKQLTGTGEEEDDGDPSNADVYLFSVEGKVYMICAHGEGNGAVKNRPVLTALLASVKKS